MRRLLPLLALAACLLVPATAAQAAGVGVIAGIGDQNASMFSNPLYTALQIKRVRYFIPWDAIDDPAALDKADAYVAAASLAGARVLMHVSTNDFTPKQAELPSVSTYKRKVGALIKRYRARGVGEWGAWNEANHKTEPTWDNPRRAAQYYVAMKGMCRGCRVVALDTLDQPGVATYIAAFTRALPAAERRASLIVGIHNYTDVNRNRSTGTAAIIKATRAGIPKARFWFTETGGIAYFKAVGSKKVTFPCDLSRQSDATTRMFALARKFDRYVDRLYNFNWQGNDCKGFDAGLVEADGSARPAYRAYVRGAKNFKR